MGKFDNVSAEPDTTVLYQQEAVLGGYEVLYQKWHWDGITAESIIFSTDDACNLTDDQLELEVKTSPLIKPESKMTITRNPDYTFVNFNFEILGDNQAS